MAWNDLITNGDAALRDADPIIACWSGAPHASFTVDNATALGFTAVQSSAADLYLINGNPPSTFWYDIGAGLSTAQHKLLAGGEATMWMGAWARAACLWSHPPRWMGVYYTQHCPNPRLALGESSPYFPAAQWMEAPAADRQFEEAFSNMVWPQAAAAAGSFWRYSSSVTGKDLEAVLAKVGRRLETFAQVPVCPLYTAANSLGLDTVNGSCPLGCNYTHKCGRVYAAPAPVEQQPQQQQSAPVFHAPVLMSELPAEYWTSNCQPVAADLGEDSFFMCECGPGLMTTNNAGKDWSVPPGGDMCTLGYMLDQPRKGMHDLGNSNTFAAPATNYSAFVANTSRGVTYYSVNATTRALSTRVVPPSKEQLLNFQLPWGVQCNNKSYFGGWSKKDCPWWSGQSGASLIVDNGTRVIQTAVVMWLGGDEGATLQNQGVHVFSSPASDTYVVCCASVVPCCAVLWHRVVLSCLVYVRHPVWCAFYYPTLTCVVCEFKHVY